MLRKVHYGYGVFYMFYTHFVLRDQTCSGECVNETHDKRQILHSVVTIIQSYDGSCCLLNAVCDMRFTSHIHACNFTNKCGFCGFLVYLFVHFSLGFDVYSIESIEVSFAHVD